MKNKLPKEAEWLNHSRKSRKKKTPVRVIIECDDANTAFAILSYTRDWPGFIQGKTEIIK